VEGAAEHEQGDHGRGERHAQVPGHAAEQFRSGGHSGELRAGRAEVGGEEGSEREASAARPIALADQRHETLARDDAHARAELVEDDERRGREAEDPQEPIAVAGPEDRVGGDPCRVVVREAGEQTRPGDGEQRRERTQAKSAPAGRERRVPTAAHRVGPRRHPGTV
jgi:hypothetical protein